MIFSYPGISLTMGKGKVYSAPQKQKLIEADNGMNQILCTKSFLDAQKYLSYTRSYLKITKAEHAI